MEIIQSFDFNVLNWIQGTLRCSFLDYFTVFLSYLTTSGIIWIVAGVVLLFFRKTRAAGIILLGALALGFITGDVLLKHVVERPRPFMHTDFALLISAPSGSSFPSTHSCLAAAATTVLLSKKRNLGYIALALMICIAFSRLYLYVHFPTDVICGLLLGAICAGVMLWIARLTKLEDRFNK
ncbi:MAG: phosphatase PAP2 family protein [Ruminococcus sp.]|jgi:undecaprenyl-diphosphatase|nr:phosphatase PAP2 family protein [Ruminococcus sp.]